MNIRRYYLPNAIVFITQVVEDRQPVFRNALHLDLLRTVMHNVKELHPFKMQAYCFLPDHFHLSIQPTGVSNFSKIMQSIKSNFTYVYKRQLSVQGAMKFWQKRFWDHLIRDEDDFQRHLDYIHYNPVAHGYVEKPEAWPHSSYEHWCKRGCYAVGWGWTLPTTLASFRQDQGLE